MKGNMCVTEIFYKARNQEKKTSNTDVSSFHFYLLSPELMDECKKHKSLKRFSWLHN